jgi:mono/diheme cytochrome c family protein
VDGSAYFRVPARRNIFIQALDENYMQVQAMRTFVNFQPGETRSCIGCHDPRAGSPMPEPLLALAKGASSLQPQPGDTGPRPLHYPADVQPILDRHCVRCHGGDAPKAGLDLRGTETEFFSASYENLLGKGAVSFLQEWSRPPGGKSGPSHVGNGAMLHAEVQPPYALGSHASKLMKLLLKGHEDVQLEQAEFVRLATWVDANAQYYGSYYGKKNIRYTSDKDFRPVPTLDSARGVKPCVARPATIPAELLGVWRQGEGDARLPDVFDGTNAVSGGGKGTRQAVSVTLRLRPDALRNEWTPLVFTDGGTKGAFHFSLLKDGTPNVAVNVDGKGGWIHGRARRALKTGEWHDLAVVCDTREGGFLQFFVDGQLAGESLLDAGVALNLEAFRIGMWNAWANAPGNNFHGAISELRLYNGTLQQRELQALRQNR